jgi:hypothetical protein
VAYVEKYGKWLLKVDKLRVVERSEIERKIRMLRAGKVGSKGVVAAVNLATGDVHFGKTLREAAQKGLQKDHKGKFYFVRVGYPAVYRHTGWR